MSQYKIYHDDKNKVVAVSSYAGRTVRGVAKCDPRDNFDLSTGVMLAEARCGLKVAEKRAARARREFIKAGEAVNVACRRLEKMRAYFEDADTALLNAQNMVTNIESNLNVEK